MFPPPTAKPRVLTLRKMSSALASTSRFRELWMTKCSTSCRKTSTPGTLQLVELIFFGTSLSASSFEFATVTSTSFSMSRRDGLVRVAPEMPLELHGLKFRPQQLRTGELCGSHHLRRHLDPPAASSGFRPLHTIFSALAIQGTSLPINSSVGFHWTRGPTCCIDISAFSGSSGSSTVPSLGGNATFLLFRAAIRARPSSLPSGRSITLCLQASEMSVKVRPLMKTCPRDEHDSIPLYLRTHAGVAPLR